MAKVPILGSGAWGTALAMLFLGNSHEVLLWSPLVEHAKELRRMQRSSVFGGLGLSVGIQFTSDMKKAGERQDVVVLATAPIYMRGAARELRPYVKTGRFLVCVARDIEEKSLLFQTDEVQEKVLGAVVACLLGPSRAGEVTRHLPTTCVMEAADNAVTEQVQEPFMNRVFRVYTSTNVKGTELGDAVKSMIALMADIADGLGYGDNTKVALITRGIMETARLGAKIGVYWEILASLTNIGDLIVTCASMHSRNWRTGILTGRGKLAEEAVWKVKQVVEGVYSAKAVFAFAERGQVEMPIVDVVSCALFPEPPTAEAMHMLMERGPITEWNCL